MGSELSQPFSCAWNMSALGSRLGSSGDIWRLPAEMPAARATAPSEGDVRFGGHERLEFAASAHRRDGRGNGSDRNRIPALTRLSRYTRTADLSGNRHHRRSLRRVIASMLIDHSHRTVAKLRRKLVARSAHYSFHSPMGASGKLGALHVLAERPIWATMPQRQLLAP